MGIYDRFLNLKARFGDLKDLELETLLNDREWDRDIEYDAAILALFKNPYLASKDPHVFSQICLVLSGITPDFLEYEYVYPEMIALTLAFIKRLENSGDHTYRFPQFEDDIKYFIAMSCIEEGIFIVKNELKEFQKEILELLKEVYGNPLTFEELNDFDKLWAKQGGEKSNSISEKSFLDVQLKKNLLNQEYVKENL